jgi:MerR family transcriptional regulator, light-induced transcriptional regulator
MTTSDSGEPIGLKAAAEQLGVHYMTAYRYVRTGRLPARTVRGEWQVTPEDLRRFQEAPISVDRRGQSRERRIQQMVHCLVAGDELAADSVSDATLASGVDLPELYLEILAPALRRIGEQWANGELSVADEHRASTCAQRLLGRVGPRFVPRGRHRGTALLAAPAGDHHGLPITMIADLLRHRGVEAIDLGADLPTDAIMQAARKIDRLGVVGLCATTRGTTRALRATIKAVHDELDGVVVALGGAAVTERMARDLGADHFSGGDGREALAALSSLAAIS